MNNTLHLLKIAPNNLYKAIKFEEKLRNGYDAIVKTQLYLVDSYHTYPNVYPQKVQDLNSSALLYLLIIALCVNKNFDDEWLLWVKLFEGIFDVQTVPFMLKYKFELENYFNIGMDQRPYIFLILRCKNKYC